MAFKGIKNLRSEQGFSLVEIMLTIVFLGLVLVPVMQMYFTTVKQTRILDLENKAVRLAQDMMEEISSLPFCDPQSTATFGLEEDVDSPLDGRLAFDDIDDFSIYSRDSFPNYAWGWESPPRDVSGQIIVGYENFSRIVNVIAVSEPDYLLGPVRNLLPVAESGAEFKLVEVQVKWSDQNIQLIRVIADTVSN